MKDDRDNQENLLFQHSRTGREIAVIGMSGRFPGAKDINEYWKNLQQGVESICFFYDGELKDSGISEDLLKKENYIKAYGVLKEIEDFDANFFGYTPREAELMDPQLRILHELVWHALEDAGYNPEYDELFIGLFAGSSDNFSWRTRTFLTGAVEEVELFSLSHLLNKDFFCVGISYRLNLKGPAVVVQSTCSTSLLAIHMACQSILNGECDIALAGGVNAQLLQKVGYLFREGMIVSPDGHCRAFSSKAGGTIPGDGAGIVVLKDLEEAEADNDNIYAIVKGSGINNDGYRKIGFTAPSTIGQTEAINIALEMSEIEPESVGYIETHGTGTQLGDPIELDALKMGYKSEKKQFCAIGSVKTNLGHLDCAAGVAGFIKAVLSLKNRKIPPSLHSDNLNPKIDFSNSPFYVNNVLREWESNGFPLRAGVSAFGIGGTNVHVILEEWHKSLVTDSVDLLENRINQEKSCQLLLLSAKTDNALLKMIRNLSGFLNMLPSDSLSDVAYTLMWGRKYFENRASMVLSSHDKGSEKLYNTENWNINTVIATENDEDIPVIFMFPGQGSQYINMGYDLYKHEPVFQKELDTCFDSLNRYFPVDLKGILYPSEFQPDILERLMSKLDIPHKNFNRKNNGVFSDKNMPLDLSLIINQTIIAQPLLFIIEYALARFLIKSGIEPQGMIGHSLGEYTAACLSGALSFSDTLALVVLRGQLMQQEDGGSMLGVPLREDQLISFLKDGNISLAAINTPTQSVVSGPSEEITKLISDLDKLGINSQRLATSHAFHSEMMNTVKKAFEKNMADKRIIFGKVNIPYISNVTGQWITDGQVCSPEYWGSHLRETVKFSQGLEKIIKSGHLLLEVGPGNTLSTLLQQYINEECPIGLKPVIINLMRHPHKKVSDHFHFLEKIGQLWGYGKNIDFAAINHKKPRRRITLPLYPFDRKTYNHIGSLKIDLSFNKEKRVTKICFHEKEEKEEKEEKNDPIQRKAPVEPVQFSHSLQEIVTDIWCKFFGLNKIDPNDDFFEIGGDSLKAVILINKIHERLDVKLSLKYLFNNSTIQELTEYIRLSQKINFVSIPVVEKKEYYILSSGQKRLFILQKLDESSIAYNMPFYFFLSKNINREKLENVLLQLIKRHESLRTCFPVVEDNPVQKVLDFSRVKFEIEEIKSETDWNMINRPFNFSQAPLLRSGLFRHADGQYTWVFVIHHIVSDGTSQTILGEDFLKLYNDNILSPLKLQYKEFALWQNKLFKNQTIKKQERYWLEKLSGEITRLNLLADYKRPEVFSFLGAVYRFKLEEKDVSAFKNLGSKNGATLYMNMLAALNVLLYRYTYQSDILIGTGIAGRSHANLQNIIGLFVNTLVMRNHPSKEMSYIDFLSDVIVTCVNAFENQDFQFEELVDILAPEKDPSRNPIFDISMDVQNFRKIRSNLFFKNNNEKENQNKLLPIDEARTPLTDYKNQTAKFDMTFFITETGKDISIDIEYYSAIYKENTIIRLASHFKNMIKEVIHDPKAQLMDIEIISTEEKLDLLFAFNNTRKEYDRENTIVSLWMDQVKKTPYHIALIFNQEQITYEKLAEEANRITFYLISQKEVLPNDENRIGILMSQRPECLISILGILQAGAAYVPLDPQLPHERIKYMIRDASINIVILEINFLNLLNKMQGECECFNHYLCIDSDNIYEDDARVLNNILGGGFFMKIASPNGSRIPVTDPQKPILKEFQNIYYSVIKSCNPAYIIYTSGTTGFPKGVIIEHSSIVNLMNCQIPYFNILKQDRILQFSPIVFDASVEQIFITLLAGATLVLAEKECLLDVQRIEELILRCDINHIDAVPSYLGILHLKNKSQLKRMISGGESCPLSLVQEWYKECRFYNQYGPTETTVTSIKTLVDFIDVRIQRVPIGTPINNTTAYILDQWLKPVPIGIMGELFIGGQGVARGYLNQPDLTAEKFYFLPPGALFKKTAPGPRKNFLIRLYKTGDLARWLADGNIEFLGRQDFQLKIRGFRIEPGEIENRLTSHPLIKEAVVIDHSNKAEDRFLCAYIVANGVIDESEVKDFLSAGLPEYMIPPHIIQLEKIPRTISGKIDRKSLPRPDFNFGNRIVPPSNEIEKQLAKIWKEILFGRDVLNESQEIGIENNFFELGGHSLNATILISRIQREFHIKIPLVEIFKTPTIRGLAKYIKKATKVNYASILPIEKKEYYSLSSAQKRLYFLQQMDINSTAYNMPYHFQLSKDISWEKLEGVIIKLIKRHESLRTFFPLVNDNPVQRILEYNEVNFEIKKFEIVPDQQMGGNVGGGKEIPKSNTVISERLNSYNRPFDLAHAPLMRSGLIKLLDGHYIWIVVIHHIISDGTSQTILGEDFINLYNGNTLSPLELQYKEFAFWQNELLKSQTIKYQERYWLEKLSGEITRLNLLTDYKRPEAFTFSGDVYGFKLEENDAKAFKILGNQYGATLYMNMLAALNVLFFRYTNQNDIFIGVGTAGRPHSDLQNIFGMFVNSLVMRNHPYGEMSYIYFLRDVIDVCLRAFENQDLQFEELVDQLDPEKDPSRNPLFDISMDVQNFRKIRSNLFFRNDDEKENQNKALSIDEARISLTNYKNQTAKFDMTFFITETGNELSIDIEYYSAIYKEKTIIRLASHFKNLIKEVIHDPKAQLMDFEIISTEEKLDLLFAFNNTRKEYDRENTIVSLWTDQVKKTPDHIALIFNQEQITYEKLVKEANRITFYLISQKEVLPNDENRIGILMSQRPECLISILGILQAGAAYVPLGPQLPHERIKYMIQDASVNIILSEKKFLNLLNKMQWECECFNHYLCVDSDNIYEEDDKNINELMNIEFWHHVGEKATDDITGGGWLSSYTGAPFSQQEMDEYGDNILKKLEPILHPKMKVFEIGCASGITMFRVAPRVGFYYGTDLSEVIINKNKKRILQNHIQNIKLYTLPAHQIHQVKERGFELIIINSVIQCFHGFNYLRKVIKKAVDLLGEQGYLFVGDIMDLDEKEKLQGELNFFKLNPENQHKGFITITEFSSELFVPKNFWRDLVIDLPYITDIEFSDKIYTIENELTKFRYDLLIKINKKNINRKKLKLKKYKYQEDTRVLNNILGGGFFLKIASPNGLQIPVSDRQEPILKEFQNVYYPVIKSCNPAYIIYTSGTTGFPKGVIIEHSSIVNLMNCQIPYFNILKQDRILQFSPVVFDASVEQIFITLLAGATLVLAEKECLLDAQRIEELILRCDINHIDAVPSYLGILQLKNKSQLKRMISGGESCPLSLVQEWYKECRFYNQYGPTETTVTSIKTLVDFIDVRRPRVPIGTPIDNTTVYILNQWLKPVPIGIMGELFIGGQGVARGYLNQPELTAEKFYFLPPGALFKKTAPGPRKNFLLRLYKTGDLARWLADGNIEFLGRQDFQLKIRGFRIEPGEIENRLISHPLIKEAVVVDQAIETEDKFLCAYIVVKATIDDSEVKNFLSAGLPEYMIPPHIIQLEKISRTISGKIDRKALPMPCFSKEGDFTAPRNDVERKLAEIWAEVLQISQWKISTFDSFFELGGHSLNAIKMISKVQKQLGIKIPMVDVFKYPTIKELGGVIKKLLKNEMQNINIISDNIIQLKGNCNCDKHFFFIHDGSGEINMYKDLCRYLDEGLEFNFWGIQAEKQNHYSPVNFTIEEIAGKYILQMKKIQPFGPYFIAGWSLGGSLAFEMVRQLEKIKERIAFFALIDTVAPQVYSNKGRRPQPKKCIGICSLQEDDKKRGFFARFSEVLVNSGKPTFNLSSEKSFIKKYFPKMEFNEKLEKKLGNTTNMKDVWQLALDYINSMSFDQEKIKRLIIEYIGYVSLGNNDVELSQLIQTLNMSRSLVNAALIYTPLGKIKSKIHHFEATEEDHKNKEPWEKFCQNETHYYGIKGNHYSIFKMPQISKFGYIFSKVLNRK